LINCYLPNRFPQPPNRVVRPWEWLNDAEKIDQLRALSTAHCFGYQRLEMRSGKPVCVEVPRR
jgi:hypothetical protein